jgi:23S rRNA pseudouridine1911/1915/1917 synthase
VSEPRTLFPVGPKDRGKRLDRFLSERIPGLSRARIQEAIRARVTLSWGVRARPATPVRPGGEVRIGWTPLAETLLEVPIPLLAREEGWLAVDKPAGIPVHPVNRIRENSLIRMLRRQEGDEGLRLVHRLDRETSGALLVAADVERSRLLSLAFERGLVSKEYVALVAGVVRDDAGAVSLPIGGSGGSKVYVRRTAGSGQEAHTEWRVERRLADRTLLRVFPRTGRRHQIRVHLAAIGHPILGDLLYGRSDEDYLALVRHGTDVRRREGGPRRQLLHCAVLDFPDPSGRGRRRIVASPPADLLAALDPEASEGTVR